VRPSSDVNRLRVVHRDDPAQAEVEAEPPQDAQASSQPVDLLVAFERRRTGAAGVFALGVEAAGQVVDRPFEALRHRREVLLVLRDQLRVGLGGEVVGKIERAARQRGHSISSSQEQGGRVGDSAARQGSCRKPPGALYVGSGEGLGPRFSHAPGAIGA
jgi:hypothetical protein